MDNGGFMIEQKAEGPNGWTVIIVGGGLAVGVAIVGLALFSLANWAGIALVVLASGQALGSACLGVARIIEARGRARAMIGLNTEADIRALWGPGDG